ncbi:NAD(P)/FAD-dependent oxidoreductase [Chryseosolibacter indicus]|uniref:NADH:ubiquinone reductase (non-electrogenic) n=1 Tax=Chryseosolibacter indicus TaxID=2782351 RepID=A0ABS5VNY2_9BACT|nr:NAD(P)/FAD-dependent oxidoreductase [Chryseosolibacter indicus]MBT1702484.1 NAD(P)/FAD-dependent oxidoreductase [Chryseosolibacter indicus]
MPNLITTRIADLGKPRVIVIGGGFGGLEVVKGLQKTQTQIVLFDKYNHHTFQPLLYQVATSGLETSSIVFPFRKHFSGNTNFHFRLAEVQSIDAEKNCIATSIGTIKYDYLVLATGAETNFYGLKDVEQHGYPMKTIIDSIKLRNIIIRNVETALLIEDKELMNSYLDVVIVGGGPTGVELAGAVAELKKYVFPKDYPELELGHMDIHLIEATPRLLNGMSDIAGRKSLEYLQEMGVKVHLNCAVKSYDGHQVVFNTGEKLISKTLIWAAGVKGNPVDGLNAESLGKASRIKVDEFNRVKGYNNIFAIGDVALMEGDPLYPNGHPMMAPPAMQQGKLVAKNIKRLMNNQSLKAFRYKNKGAMATIGRNKAVVDLKTLKFQGFFAWLVWMFVHLISIIGFKNKFFVFMNWLLSYFSYDKSNRLIIARPKDGVQ